METSREKTDQKPSEKISSDSSSSLLSSGSQKFLPSQVWENKENMSDNNKSVDSSDSREASFSLRLDDTQEEEKSDPPKPDEGKWSNKIKSLEKDKIKFQSSSSASPLVSRASPDDSVISVPQQILDGYPARNMPRGIHDQGKQLVYINKANPEIDVTGKVPREDVYIIIAEYYQPNHPGVTLRVNVTNGPFADRPGGDQISAAESILPPVYEAILPLPTCASNIGCRAPVMKNNRPAEVPIVEEFDITFINDDPEGAWIEYVYTVPAADFNDNKDSLLKSDDSVDEVDRYEKECGKDSFYVPDTVEDGFCKASITSISSMFNGGAVNCECDPDGSIDQYNCNSFGGQ